MCCLRRHLGLRHFTGLLLLCAVAPWQLACRQGVEPQPLHPLATARPRTPVIIVPGTTGSMLRSTASGELLWGEGRHVLRPRDDGYALARPLALPLAAADPAIEPAAVIEEMRLFAGLVRKPIYGPVPEALERQGFQRGELTDPADGDDLFLYAYDWRSDNVLAAQRLGRRLESLAARHGDEPLAVDLVCQSNGAYICRYLVKFGLASLEEAEQGRRIPLDGVSIRKLVLIGTSNGGSLRILREVDRGRTYVSGLGRRMAPEVIFTFPSIYQDLPSYLDHPFIDRRGQPVELDLYDAATWVEQGWSVFAPGIDDRLDRRPDLFADRPARIAFLSACLDRAKRLHGVLHRDGPEASASRYYLLQNAYYPTAQRAIVQAAGEGSKLLFPGDKELAKDAYLSALASAPGDGHATLDSQMYLSPKERASLAADPFFVAGKHFELIIDPATLRRMLDFLLAP